MIVDNSKNLAKITYLILIERSEVTPFNKYEKLKIQKQNIISNILTLPRNIYEIYMTKENMIYQRIKGLIDGYDINYIYDIDEIKNYTASTKCIVISEIDDIIKIGKKYKEPIIFLSENLNDDESINLYNLTSLTVKKFQNIFEELLNYHNRRVQQEFLEIKEFSLTEKTGEYINIESLLNDNLYTSSNLLTLKSMRANFSWEKDDEILVDNIKESIDLIEYITTDIYNNLHKSIPIKPIYQYLISDMSYNLDFSLNNKAYTKHSLYKNKYVVENLDEFVKSLQLIKRNEISINSKNDYITDYYNERLYIEKLISIQTASFCIPNIKLSINNNKYKALLKEIGKFSRDNNSNINKSFLNLEKQFSNDIKDWFTYINNDYSVELKLVSNLPLEWCPHNGLPLMIKNEVSRIPVSFGNVAEKLLMDTEQIYLPAKAFSKILFITSFEDDDNIRYHLKSKINIVQEYNKTKIDKNLLKSNDITKNIDISKLNFNNKIEVQEVWKDISTVDELIDTLNKNTSTIIVFDLHGGHDENEEGVIFIKGKAVPISELFGKVKIPPIVILSSCDTQPLDRNHYSTANAFLLMGAKTVLASAVPILSHEASTFIARLLTRISIFLPIRLSQYNIRWSEFITGMNRQSYYTELINALQREYNFSKELKSELLFFVNTILNPLQDNFNEKILKEIGTKIDITNEKINLFIANKFKFPECLKYIQIGNPELITIATEENMIKSFKN